VVVVVVARRPLRRRWVSSNHYYQYIKINVFYKGQFNTEQAASAAEKSVTNKGESASEEAATSVLGKLELLLSIFFLRGEFRSSAAWWLISSWVRLTRRACVCVRVCVGVLCINIYTWVDPRFLFLC